MFGMQSLFWYLEDLPVELARYITSLKYDTRHVSFVECQVNLLEVRHNSAITATVLAHSIESAPHAADVCGVDQPPYLGVRVAECMQSKPVKFESWINFVQGQRQDSPVFKYENTALSGPRDVLGRGGGGPRRPVPPSIRVTELSLRRWLLRDRRGSPLRPHQSAILG